MKIQANDKLNACGGAFLKREFLFSATQIKALRIGAEIEITAEQHAALTAHDYIDLPAKIYNKKELSDGDK